jgi:hypothetical protein
MNVQNETAANVSAQTAVKNKTYKESYRKSALLSSLKEQIGQLLVYMQTPLSKTEKRYCWRLFEANLRQYYAVKPPYRILQNATGKGFSGAESTNSGQGYIG